MPRPPHPVALVTGDGSVRPGDLVGFNPQPDPPRDPFALLPQLKP